VAMTATRQIRVGHRLAPSVSREHLECHNSGTHLSIRVA